MFWLNTEFQPQYGRFQLVRSGHDRLVPLHERPVRLLPIDVPRQMNRRFRPARCAVHSHDIADLVAWLPARNLMLKGFHQVGVQNEHDTHTHQSKSYGNQLTDDLHRNFSKV
uniref:Uncharacterized protein n=1 Tax=Anopheles coluzzii TaxID=1518534 RepID=A0A8W7PF87_ANOCL